MNLNSLKAAVLLAAAQVLSVAAGAENNTSYIVLSGKLAFRESEQLETGKAPWYVTPAITDGGMAYIDPGKGRQYEAHPPAGCQMRKDEDQWALFFSDEFYLHHHALGEMTNHGKFPQNAGYTVTVTNAAKAADSTFAAGAPTPTSGYLYLVPLFHWIRYDLRYNGNCDSYPGDYFGNDAGNRDIVYTNTVTMAAPSWSRSPYYRLAGFSTNSAAATADFRVGASVPRAGEALGVTAPGMLTNPEVRLYAVWEPRRITVTLNPNGGDPLSPSSFIITGEERCPDLPTPTWAYYDFVGWFRSDGTTQILPGCDLEDVEDFTLYAYWTPVVREITLDPDGGSVASNTLWVAGAETCPALPEPERSNSVFLGWYNGDAKMQEGDAVASNMTLTAHYSAVVAANYTVRFTWYDGTGWTTNEQTVADGAVAALPDAFDGTARTGYSFIGWDGDAFAAIDGDVLFTAQYSPVTFYVSFNANGGSGTMDPNPQTFTYDVPGTLSSNVFTLASHAFLGWATNSLSTAADYADGATVSNLTATAGATVPLYAVWEYQSGFSDLAEAADSNIDLTSESDAWQVSDEQYSKGDSSASVSREEGHFESIDMSATVNGAGTLTFKWRLRIDLMGVVVVQSTEAGGMAFYLDGGEVPGVEPPGKDDWSVATVQVAGAGAHTFTWKATLYTFEDDTSTYSTADNGAPYTAWIDEVTWTPGNPTPAEANRPGIASFDPSADGGFSLSVSNASDAFDYRVLTNSVLAKDSSWGVMTNVPGGASLVVPIAPADGASQMFYKVEVVEKEE
jgi:uncharacterized repeat protein (TIGR02543 family)